MVYNAMKKFMEINPQFFDECSHEYNERQNTAERREKDRLNKWDKLAGLAQDRRNGIPAPPVQQRPPSATDTTEDETDHVDETIGSPLNSLKLQDDPSPGKERRRVRENPVSD